MAIAIAPLTSLGDEIQEKANVSRGEHYSFIQDNRVAQNLILDSISEDRAIELLEKVSDSSSEVDWGLFEGQRYITPSEVGAILGMAANTPKSYMASHKEKMTDLGARVFSGNELKNFFAVTGKKAQGSFSAMGLYTPKSVLLIGMIVKKLQTCKKLQRIIAQAVGLLPDYSYPQEQPDPYLPTQMDLMPQGESLYKVFENDDDPGLENIADILARTNIEDTIRGAAMNSMNSNISVPLVEGLAVNGVVLGDASADSFLDLFKKYESYLSEGVKAVFYCDSCQPNARLVVALLEQAGYQVQLVVLDEAKDQQ